MNRARSRNSRWCGPLGWAAANAMLAAFVVPTVATGSAEEVTTELRVCADPNNLPYSNRDEAGFENKLAEFVATKLGKQLTYVWQPQRRAYIRTGLGSDACDILMGVPVKFERVEATLPYYRSTYVFVYRSDRHFDLQSIKDQRLRKLSVGVQLIGNDGYNTPPAHALSEQGIINNVVGYTVYGDYRQPNPSSRIVEAVESGAVDLAAVWGPVAGYFAKLSPVSLTVAPIGDTDEFKPLLFQYDIAIGVRKGNHALRSQIDGIIARHRTEITRLLEDYSVPLVTNGEDPAGH